MSHWDEHARRPVIACDLGGTKLRVAVVSPDGTLVTHADIEIRHLTYPQVMDTLVEAVRDLSVRYPAAQAVGISAAGNVDRALGTVNFQAVTTEAVLRPVTNDLINPPSCPYQTVPLVARVTSATKLPAVIENDGNAFVLGEAAPESAGGRPHRRHYSWDRCGVGHRPGCSTSVGLSCVGKDT